MERDEASRTARMTTYCRWHHTRYDSPLIFRDDLAGAILGEDGRDEIETLLLGTLQRRNPDAAAAFTDKLTAISWMMQSGASSPIVLARARYAEESLDSAIEEGTTQYVILGAGLDTFAFRRPDLVPKITIFEVDHYATQCHKLERIREMRWQCPHNLRFVPVDFERSHLTPELLRNGFDPAKKTFFSWLGVSYYLSDGHVKETMRQVASLASGGSSLVFDYLDLSAYHPEKAAPRVIRMLESVTEIGEPMLSGFDAPALAAALHGCGWELAENLAPNQIHRRYFLGRTDHHRACEHVHFARAVIGK